MNYEKLYFAFMKRYKSQMIEVGVYTEKHHIIPRHAGGDDSAENIICLTYKQHVFAHRLLWKTYKRVGDYHAWLMMSGQEACSVLANHKAIGAANVASGHWAYVQSLANTPSQREQVRRLGEENVASGHMDRIRKLANEVWTGSFHTDEFKSNRAEEYKVLYSLPENRERILLQQKMASKVRTRNATNRSEQLILNAERNEEFLQETSSRSKNKFISPEGLEFDSPISAAKYYGNIDYYIIENWCKRSKYGWSRKPKAV